LITSPINLATSPVIATSWTIKFTHVAKETVFAFCTFVVRSTRLTILRTVLHAIRVNIILSFGAIITMTTFIIVSTQACSGRMLTCWVQASFTAHILTTLPITPFEVTLSTKHIMFAFWARNWTSSTSIISPSSCQIVSLRTWCCIKCKNRYQTKCLSFCGAVSELMSRNY
jgi:hypothetical protein